MITVYWVAKYAMLLVSVTSPEDEKTKLYQSKHTKPTYILYSTTQQIIRNQHQDDA